MSLNMMIETEGRNYTASEYTAWLKDAASSSPAPSGSTPPVPTAQSSHASPNERRAARGYRLPERSQ